MEIPATQLQENARRWFLNYCRTLEEDVNAKKQIIENPEYMDWLYNELESYGIIEYDQEGMDYHSKRHKVGKQLKTLFNIIRDYANINYIISNLDNDGTSYYISYKDILFKLGFSFSNNGIIFIARKIPDSPNISPIIPFTAVRENTHFLNYNAEVRKELVELTNYITAIKKSGITDDEIIYTTAKALKYVK